MQGSFPVKTDGKKLHGGKIKDQMMLISKFKYLPNLTS